MSKLSERDIVRELAGSESFEPPAGLLDKIKAEIPPEIRVGTPVPPTVSPRFVPRQRWLIAASLVATVGAGLVALRTWEWKEEESLKVEVHVAAPQSAVAKTAPHVYEALRASPPAQAAAPISSESRLEPEAAPPPAAMAPPPPPPPPAMSAMPASPKPAAKERRDQESDYLSEQSLKARPAQPPAVPENRPAPAPARRDGSSQAEKTVEGPSVAGAVGGATRGAPADAENQLQRQEAAASTLHLGKQYQLKDEKDKKADDAVRSKTAEASPFLDATTYPLSTFGLGVETGSFAVARRDLRAGHLPDPASVRVEEWLSYFDYGDPAPTQGDFAIRAEGAPSPFAQGPAYRWLRLNVTGTPQTAARNVKAQVEFNSVVVARYRLLGSGAGHSVTALYEIELRPNAPRWEQPVATLHLRYQESGVGNTTEKIRRVGFQDFAPSWEAASPSLRLAALVAELAEILKGSPWAKTADLGDVARRIQETARQLPGNAKVTELADLAARAARIKGAQGGSEEQRP